MTDFWYAALLDYFILSALAYALWRDYWAAHPLHAYQLLMVMEFKELVELTSAAGAHGRGASHV